MLTKCRRSQDCKQVWALIAKYYDSTGKFIKSPVSPLETDQIFAGQSHHNPYPSINSPETEFRLYFRNLFTDISWLQLSEKPKTGHLNKQIQSHEKATIVWKFNLQCKSAGEIDPSGEHRATNRQQSTQIWNRFQWNFQMSLHKLIAKSLRIASRNKRKRKICEWGKRSTSIMMIDAW
jgi:hypothetical protein